MTRETCIAFEQDSSKNQHLDDGVGRRRASCDSVELKDIVMDKFELKSWMLTVVDHFTEGAEGSVEAVVVLRQAQSLSASQYRILVTYYLSSF